MREEMVRVSISSHDVSSFRAPQSESTVLGIDCGDTTTGEKGSESTISATQLKAEENRSPLKASLRNPTMIFRRRIVLLTLALIVSILIITLTIVGVIMSSTPSHQELTEAEAGNTKNIGTEKEIKKNETTVRTPVVGGSQSEIETLFIPSATAEISGSGSGPSNTERDPSVFTLELLGSSMSPESSSDDSFELDLTRFINIKKASNSPVFLQSGNNEIMTNEDLEDHFDIEVTAITEARVPTTTN